MIAGAEVSLETAARNHARAGTAATKRSILIVEDHEMVAKALRAVLIEAGFEVEAFTTGRAALRHVVEHRPDAAILDIHLPDINGLVLTRRLRDVLGPRTPLIVLSGDTSMETINSLPHVGATHFFPKPVHGGRLVAQLREWVEESKRDADPAGK